MLDGKQKYQIKKNTNEKKDWGLLNRKYNDSIKKKDLNEKENILGGSLFIWILFTTSYVLMFLLIRYNVGYIKKKIWT